MNIFSSLKKQKWVWLAVLLLIIGIKVWAQNNYHVENFYTNDFYYFFSAILRFLFGWIPFSVGDILYFIAGLWIFLKLMKNTALLFKKKFTRDLFVKKFWKLVLIFLSTYIVFNVFWGLNYNRKGIAWQLK